eukprot:COSAG02_NODE_4754_length_5022_cov_2.228113_1_plen_55_part_10
MSSLIMNRRLGLGAWPRCANNISSSMLQSALTEAHQAASQRTNAASYLNVSTGAG